VILKKSREDISILIVFNLDHLAVLAVLAAAVLTAFHPSVVAVAILLLAVRFGALAALPLPAAFAAHLLSQVL
jgi:hypothetical protein